MKSFSAHNSLLSLTLLLLFWGMVTLSSASSGESLERYGNSYYFLLHQLVFGAIPGVILLILLSKINYHFWQKMAPFLMFIVLALLIAVLLPGVGLEFNGARRWLNMRFGVFQPSELAKLVLIIYLAAWFDKKQKTIHDFLAGFLPSIIIVGAVALLIYLQPDLGTLIVICLTAATMFFMAGTKIIHLLGTISLGLTALVLAIFSANYRAARVITFLDPSHDPQGIGYHVNQALLAIGSGGLLGLGFNNSVQKHNFLPEPMTDSIFAVMSEEMGFFWMIILITLFLTFAWGGLNVAKKARDNFGRLLAVGITSWIVIQAFVNIAAMLNLVPLTGIPLPFFSYGSSALIVTLSAIGILLNIRRQAIT